MMNGFATKYVFITSWSTKFDSIQVVILMACKIFSTIANRKLFEDMYMPQLFIEKGNPTQPIALDTAYKPFINFGIVCITFNTTN